MAKTLLDTRKTGQRVRTFIFLCADAHADAHRRTQTHAKFFSCILCPSCLCLGLESLSPPVLAPCW